MKKRVDGYVFDVEYPLFFYKELQPLWLSTVLSFEGFSSKNITEEFSYLELGCATGINLLISASLNPNGYFVGVDFNQNHINFAKKYAQHLNLKNIEFINCDFDNFLNQNQKYFDFIVCHGTWSWISYTNQQTILNIVSKFLNDLGIFYLHYMCYPGSAPLVPIQKLLNLVDYHNDKSSNESIKIAKKLFDELNFAGTFCDYPKIESICKTLNTEPSYLSHEFLTDYWNPSFSVDVHNRVFNNTSTNFLCSANILENLNSISIPLTH